MQIVITFDSMEEMKSFRGSDAVQTVGKAVPLKEAETLKSAPEPEKEEAPPAPVKEEVPPEPAKEERTYTLVEVRGALAALNKAGKKEQVQELIRSFGADRLSGIPEERLTEVMEKAGEL